MALQETGHEVKIWYIKHYDFFGGLNGEAHKFAKQKTTMKSYRPKEMIYITGQDDNIYLLKKGQVKISRITEGGEEIIQDILRPGEIFGSLPMMDDFNGAETEYAQSANESVVCYIPKSDYEKLLEINPKMNQRLTKWYGIRLRRFEERMNDLIFKDVKRRIAGFLLRYARDFGKVDDGVYEVKPMLTHEEIGLLTGAARQTVTSTLNEFKKQGLLEFDRRCWRFPKMDELKEMAE